MKTFTSCCNWGSTRISLHIFVNSLAVIFRIWLRRIEIKQPFLHHLHEGACYISKLASHSQLVGNLRRSHVYRIRIKSQNNYFVNSYPFPVIGNVINQLEARCSQFSSSKHRWLSLRLFRNLFTKLILIVLKFCLLYFILYICRIGIRVILAMLKCNICC